MQMETYGNPVLNQLPQHLKRYIVPQHYQRYTAIDQAVWRYVMRQNYAYLRDIAYYPYIPGLRKAGLTIEEIPNLQAMNDSLKKIGWGAATVDGFIPPAAFMEFQAYRVLVVAADIRQIEHIEYTPAPDIIHESSGHAPIIGEPEYAAYLQYLEKSVQKRCFQKRISNCMRPLGIYLFSKKVVVPLSSKLKRLRENYLISNLIWGSLPRWHCLVDYIGGLSNMD